MTSHDISSSVVATRARPPAWLVRLIVALEAVLFIGGALSIRAESSQQHESAYRELASAAHYKAKEIVAWKDGIERTLRVWGTSDEFAKRVERIASGAPAPDDSRRITRRLTEYKQGFGFSDIWLAGPDGKRLVAAHDADAHVSPSLREALARALESRDVRMSDIHRPAPGQPPHVDFVLPVPTSSSASPPVAAIIACVDADESLNPLVAAWPMPSASAETVLIQRDGKSVSILTPLRHATDPPLSKSLPLAGGTVEALAAAGSQGSVDGVDYRGVRVIAHAEPVPGTPWILLSKVDRSEALAPWRAEEVALLLIIALLQLGVVGAGATFWSRRTAEARRLEAERFATVLDVLKSKPYSQTDLLTRLAHAVMKTTRSQAAAVYRYDAQRRLMRPDVRLSESIAQPEPASSSHGWVPLDQTGAWAEPIRTGEPLIINGRADRVVADRGYARHHLALDTFLAVPILVDGEPVAVAGIANRPGGYDERDAAEVALVFEAAWHEVERLRALENLESLNATLEQRVQERTEELVAANEELQAQADELATSYEELTAVNEELLAQTEELNAANRELEAQAEQLSEQAQELEQRSQELAEANETKIRFLRTMSHELRTPLNSIIGFTDLLLQGLAGPLSDEQQRQIEMVNASGHHLLTLVNDLIDLSRIEAGAIVLAHEPVGVAELVLEAVETLRPAAANKGLRLTLDVPDPAPQLVSDRARVRQILLNLLTNAIKFTESGSVHLAVSTDGHRTVSFAVRDTGPGIPREDQRRIFDDFVRLSAANGTEGAGLGLPISYRLAQALGGSLTVKSAVGEGSTFTLTLPQE